jgi:hypothetical protein
VAPLLTFIAGDVWTSQSDFSSSDTPIDPTQVAFAYSIAGAEAVQYLFGSGGSPQIVKLSTGAYQITIDTTGFATSETGPVQVAYIWASGGAGQGIQQGTIQVSPPVIEPNFEGSGDPIYLEAGNNLDDVANVDTALANLGIQSAGLQPTSAFDAAGAAATAEAAAKAYSDPAGSAAAAQTASEFFATGVVAEEAAIRASEDSTLAAEVTAEIARAETAEAQALPLAGGTMTGVLSMGSNKITNVAPGTAGTDVATVSQIPTGLAPTGAVGGDLSGTLPDPTVAKIDGIALSGTPSNLEALVATSGTTADWQPVVNTFNGRAGGVVPQTGDYSPAQVGADPVGSAATVQTNVEEFATAGVAVETTRAEAAEATITTSVATEVSRAETAEGILSTSVATERTRAEAAESTLTMSVTTERTRAEAAEAALVPLAGGTMTGHLTLSGAPTSSLHAATKAYVDANAITGAVELTGGTMSGPLVLSGEPTQSLQAAPKAYVDAETTRAEAAEATLVTSVTTERVRAEAAESTLAPKVSPALTGIPTVPTASPGNNTTQAASTAFVVAAVSSNIAGVSSFNGRSGLVVPTNGDYTVGQVTGAAALVSPAFTGTPTAPTASALTDNTQVATTAYADLAVGVEKTRAQAAEAALLVSPALTGTPTAPTQTTGDTTTKIATDQFVATAVGVETTRATAAETLLAPKASPTFTGIPAVPTASNGTNTTQAASTQFVQNAVIASVAGVSSFEGRTGAVNLAAGDVESTFTTANQIYVGTGTATGQLISHLAAIELLFTAAGQVIAGTGNTTGSLQNILSLLETQFTAANQIIVGSGNGTGQLLGHLAAIEALFTASGQVIAGTGNGTGALTNILALLETQFSAAGQIIYGTGTNTGSVLAPGAAGTILANVGSTGAVQWESLLTAVNALTSIALAGTPTAPTAALATNTTLVATTAFVGAAIAALLTAVDTLTNKRVVPRVLQVSGPGASVTFDTDNYDTVIYTNIATGTTFGATGTPNPGEGFLMYLQDNGVSQTLAFSSLFVATTVPLPTHTTAGQRMKIDWLWNETTSKYENAGVV